MKVGEPVARPWQRAVRILVHPAPSGGVARLSSEFGTPQKRRPIRHSLLRSAAMPVERDGVPIQWQRLRPIAGLNFAEREMPAEMAIEKSIAWIGGEPGGQVGAGRVSARRSHNKYARTRARHARCSSSSPRIVRSSAGRQRAAHPRTAPWHDRPGTTNRRRNAGRGCPSAPRSGASARCGRKRRSRH